MWCKFLKGDGKNLNKQSSRRFIEYKQWEKFEVLEMMTNIMEIAETPPLLERSTDRKLQSGLPIDPVVKALS